LSVRLTREVAEGLSPLVEGSKPVTPIVPFLEASAGVGHVNIYPEMDGVVRREVPAVKYGERFYPSYALQLVMRYLGLKGEEVVLTPGKSVQVGKVTVPLDAGQSMLVTFNGPDHTFRYYSFHEVLEGKVSPDAFRDKIVILGPSATGVATLYVTPVAQGLPSVEFIANVIENMLGQRFLVRPDWAAQAELGLIAFFALFIMFGLPRLKAVGGATVTLLLLGSLLGGGFYLFVERGWWVKVVYPSFLLLAGYLVIVTKRFVFTEKGKELVEASAIETNKMLGLSFQGQGMLDMAFEKFRLCPVDENMLETLYNLGLDFERKRQYAKAVSVYKHIETSDAKYKDIQEKIKTLSAAAEGAVFGGIGGKSPEGTVLITGGASKPMLGRYEILKELGRGAMGIVYLGKDPKINRQVAIKTLMLGEGSSAEETKQIKDRFFREAESAGTLNHPGIVKIYDAGEEQDICFIAMELLDGHDLTKFGTKEGMLDPLTAMDYVARVAEALDFAHGQGIVHRDIKPANIMLLKDGTIRVADFGIARITASSKTATGTVMGTPSYMSPEQIAGRKVDGRSDLFSLGVALFELLTGEKPFKGGEGIGTLLFQIANDPEPEPLAVNPKMPRCASAVVHKALKKQPDERYQKGSEMAADLKACIERVKSGKDTAAAQEPPSSKGGLSPLPQRAEVPAAPAPAPAPAPAVAAAAPAPEPEPAPVAPVPAPAPAAAAPESAETVVLPPAAEGPLSSEGGLSPLPQGAAAEGPLSSEESATAWMADAAPTLSAAAAAEAPAPEPAPVESTMSFEPAPEAEAAPAAEESALPASADMTLSVE
ncbi:MAG: serine/threonine-protein kinase, partial [Elusimicrobiota bacterium]